MEGILLCIWTVSYGQVDDEENTDVEKVLTAEEIAKLYEDKDPDENFPPSLSTHQPNL